MGRTEAPAVVEGPHDVRVRVDVRHDLRAAHAASALHSVACMLPRRKTSEAWGRTTGDHSPRVLRRLLALRQVPFLAELGLSELALLAENVVESTFVKGEQMMPGGRRPPSVHHLLRGRIEMVAPAPMAWTPPATVGLLEVLAGRALLAPVVAASEVDTLELDAADLFEVLDEHFGLLRYLLRELAARAIALALPDRVEPSPALRNPGPLGLVERMTFIRRHLPLLAARMQPLASLAHSARELEWAPGEIVTRAGASDRDALIVIEGAVAASRNGEESRLLGPGAASGALEVLSGRATDHELVAVADTRALAISSSAIFDALEDSPELGLAIARSLAAAILDGRAHGTRATTAESNS
jgi:CRP-like cAMP-binding protein